MVDNIDSVIMLNNIDEKITTAVLADFVDIKFIYYIKINFNQMYFLLLQLISKIHYRYVVCK